MDGVRLTNGRVFADDFAPGMTDGVRADIDGNVWCSMGWARPAEDGVRCYAPDGDLIGKIHLPEGCANLCFGGRKKDRLFMCASTSVYSLYLNGRGALVPSASHTYLRHQAAFSPAATSGRTGGRRFCALFVTCPTQNGPIHVFRRMTRV